MEATAQLLEAISRLLWPLFALGLVLAFRPAIAGIIESARSRKFTLKIGGQELTMDEASEQQRNLIADLQRKVAEMRKELAGARAPEAVDFAAPQALPARKPSSVLWVDDHPKNNSYFVEQLTKLGVGVDLALSTPEALEKLKRRGYSVLISDMGRAENGKENATAGLDLLAIVRERYPDLPVVFFCSPYAARRYAAEAQRLGARGISSSATELFGLLHLEEVQP